jgi:hypothetical protein
MQIVNVGIGHVEQHSVSAVFGDELEGIVTTAPSMPPLSRLASMLGDEPSCMTWTSLTLIFQRCSIINNTEWDTAPMRVTPTRLPFRSAGVFMSGLVINRCSPLLTTLATITVSPPRSAAATNTSPAEFTSVRRCISALMPRSHPGP